MPGPELGTTSCKTNIHPAVLLLRPLNCDPIFLANQNTSVSSNVTLLCLRGGAFLAILGELYSATDRIWDSIQSMCSSHLNYHQTLFHQLSLSNSLKIKLIQNIFNSVNFVSDAINGVINRWLFTESESLKPIKKQGKSFKGPKCNPHSTSTSTRHVYEQTCDKPRSNNNIGD